MGSRSRARPSPVSCGDRAVEAEEPEGQACVSAARPASAIWRTDPDRRQSARLGRGRRPRCTLIVFIDDATSRLTALRFAPVEWTRAYLETLQCHILEHGCPLAFYSDRHGIFRVNAKDAQSGDGKTEFGRVAARLKDRRPRHCATRGEGDAASLRCWRYERPLQRPVATGHGLRDLSGP
jgi:hypothetical protein